METKKLVSKTKLVCILLVVCCTSCIGLLGRKAPKAPLLALEIDSLAAEARLEWSGASGKRFLFYEIQRAQGEGPFATIARVETAADTTLVDGNLYGDTVYRYRAISHFGKKDKIQHSLVSAVSSGGLYRQVGDLSLPEGFLPTRLAVDSRERLLAVGAGAGRIERFDGAGTPLAAWVYADSPPACLETGTLDGPVLAVDSGDNVYVAYNLAESGQAPKAFWSKFDPAGQLLWKRPLEGLFVRHIAIDGQGRIFIESISQLHQFDGDGTQVAQHMVPALLVASLRFWRGQFAALVEPLNYVDGTWGAPRLVTYAGVERSAPVFSLGRNPLSETDRGSGLLQRPSDFAVDEAASLIFVVNAGAGRIEVFQEEHFLTRWGEKDSFRFRGEATVVDDLETSRLAQRQVVAGGIALSGEGYVYVGDTFNNRIKKFAP